MVTRICLVIALFSVCGISIAYSAGKNCCGGGETGFDAISFPGETQRRSTISRNAPSESDNETTPYIANTLFPPLAFIQRLANYSVSDLLINYVDGYEEDTVLANRFGEEVERSRVIQPKSAACMPEMQTVKLAPESPDPSIIFIPACTRIERCGGCCSHNLLACTPSETELASFKVIKTQFTSGNRLKFVGKEVIHLEKHVKCHCGCRVQPSDCTPLQQYSKDECKCKCANQDEEKKCHAKSSLKLWDYTTCTCNCRNVSQCTTGFTFDANSCGCISIPKRRHVLLQRTQQEEELQEKVPYQFQDTIDDYDY